MIVSPGEYIELNDKIICLNCVEKKSKKREKRLGASSKKVDEDYKPMKGPKKPLLLKIIIVFVFIFGFSSLFLLGFPLLLIKILGLVFFGLFIATGIGLAMLSNIARLTLIWIYVASVLMDILLISYATYSYMTTIRILIGVGVIVYLTQDKVRKLFK
jgi:hypothetical protein